LKRTHRITEPPQSARPIGTRAITAVPEGTATIPEVTTITARVADASPKTI
jgi:hypothetical protein